MKSASMRSVIRSTILFGLAAGGMTVVLLLAVYAVRGIWPFGTDNIAYVDTAQFYLPDYYRIWDALHGAPLHVNWFSGLAEGGNASISTLLSLPNLAFLLVSRDHVLEGLGLYLAIWLAIVAFTASIAVRLRFRGLHPAWQAALVLLYTFSGYVLQYYSNFFWLWVVALFPLLLFSLERLLRNGKYILYTIVFACLAYNSIYFTYMLTAYILLFTLGYTVFILPKELRGDRLLRLGLSTAAAFGISAFSWLRSSASMAGTSRFRSNLDAGLMDGLTTWDITNTRHTALMLLGSALALALLITALRRIRQLSGERYARAKRAERFFLFVLGMLAIPMVFTNIDAAWHFGQYNFFPMRYGFALTGTLLAAAGLSLELWETADTAPAPRDGRSRAIRAVCAAAICAALAFLEPRLGAYFREYGAVFLTAFDAKTYWLRYFPLFVGCGVLLTALYLILLRLENRRLTLWLTAAAVLLQLAVNSAGLIAPNDDHVSTREYDPAYVDVSDSLYEYFSETDPTALTRAKNVDSSLNAGYPVLAGVSSASSVNSENSDLRLGVYDELGYTTEYFRILDVGGTVFTDMLFGVDIILSARELDSSLYTDTGVIVDGMHIGTANFPGVIGLTYDEGALDGYLDELSFTGRLNRLYRAFTGSDEALAAEPQATLTAEGAGFVSYTLTCRLPTRSLLYMSSDEMLMRITVNGESLTVPTYQNPDFTVYPAAFNSNMLYLGTFDAGEVTVAFTAADGVTLDNFTLAALDEALLSAFREDADAEGVTVSGSARSDRVTVTVPNAAAGRRLFLPLTYSARWQITVNGRAAAADRTLGVLTSVPLEAGENTVSITRGPSVRTFTAADALSLVSLALCAAWLILRRRAAVTPPRWVYAAAQALFLVIVTAVTAFLYVVPTVLLIARGTVVPF